MIPNQNISKNSVVEIFSSIQGEGKYVGCRQLFVRLAGCNRGCYYCDTDHSAGDSFSVDGISYKNPLSHSELFCLLLRHYDLSSYHSVSITGGEPTENVAFLYEILSLLKGEGVDTFLETAPFVPACLLELKDVVDIFSIDIKMHESNWQEAAVLLFDVLKSMEKDKFYLKILINGFFSEVSVHKLCDLMSTYGIKEIYINSVDNAFEEQVVEKYMKLFYTKGCPLTTSLRFTNF